MYDPVFEDEFCKDRNQSFRTAVRAPKRKQQFTRCHESDAEHSGSPNTATAAGWTKYNWKRFLPWAPRAKGYVCTV